MTHISIDVETFDNSPDSALATIGAVSTEGPEFYKVVEDPNGSYSPRTIRWHANQENTASNVGADVDPVSLRTGLFSFSNWLRDHGAEREGEAHLWAHANFDFPVLKMAYDRVSIQVPWHYRNTRDLRTLYALSGIRPTFEVEGVHHALRDAKYQLKEVRACLSHMGKMMEDL